MKEDRKSDGSPAQFTPLAFADVLEQLPDGCPIVGGQAVAYWAERYGLRGSNQEAITSRDIDFWGDREALQALAKKLGVKPIFPHAYEMTVWVGAIPLKIDGKKSLADFLHSIPGLDIIDPEQASVAQTFEIPGRSRKLQVLTPVSLALAKLHALRHFDQNERQDESHLKVSLRASAFFLADAIQEAGVRYVLWNVERLISASALKAYRRLEQHYQFSILSAVPIERIREVAYATESDLVDREKLGYFLERRWKQILSAKPHQEV